MQFLRANTQVIVTTGPFVDVGDGFTPQTDIALSAAALHEAELIKHGSTSVVDISGATWAPVTNCRGYYSLTLTASHVDTEGLLVVIVQDDSDCLPVKQEFMVLSEAAWDSLFAAKDSGVMSVDVTAVDGTAQRATDLAEIAQYLIANSCSLATAVADNSIIAQMLAHGGTIGDYDKNDDSLEAIRNYLMSTRSDVQSYGDAILDDTGTSGVVLAPSEDIYWADIHFTRDSNNAQDEYEVVWIKNGTPVASGITVPKIQVINRTDGSDLVAATAMTQIGSTATYKYDEDTNRLTTGEAALVVVTATIDGSTRTWKRMVGRDSAA
jgi:hypothetical protein